MSQDAPTHPLLGDANQGLLVPEFATFAIPVQGSSPFPTSGQGYRIPGNRTLAVSVANNSAATIWISPGGGGTNGIGVPVRPFTTKTFLTNTEYVGVFVGTPLLGTLSATTQSISLTLSSTPLTPAEIPIQRPAAPGVPQAQLSGATSAQSIVITAVAGSVITCLSLSVCDFTGGGTPGVHIKDGTTIVFEGTTGSGTPFSPNLGPGLAGTVGNSMTFTIDATAAGISALSIITTQGPI